MKIKIVMRYLFNVVILTLALILTACGGGVAEQSVFQKNLIYTSFWDSGIRTENHYHPEYNLNTIREVSGFTNVVTISVIGYGYVVAPGTLDAIDEAIANNKKIILIVWNVFFEDSRLAKDYKLRMQLFRDTVVNPHREHILAFYIEDEPYLSKEAPSNIQVDINTLISELKEYYPEIHSIISYSYIELDRDIIKHFNTNADWIVANLYYQQLKDPNLIKYYLDKLASHKKGNQSIMFMLDAFFVGKKVNGVIECNPSEDDQSGSLSVNKAAIDWANNNPDTPVIASFIFLYNNTIELDGTVICGAISMPQVLEQIKSL